MMMLKWYFEASSFWWFAFLRYWFYSKKKHFSVIFETL